MLKIEPQELENIAGENGWLHASGRLRGTINATAMADALHVAKSTITRAYDTGAIGPTLISRIATQTGRSLDSFVKVAA